MDPSKLDFASEEEFALDYIARHRGSVGTTTVPYTKGPVLKYGAGHESIFVGVHGHSKKGIIADSDIGTMALGYRHPKLLSFWQHNYPLLTEHADAPGRYWALRDVEAGWRMFPEISPAILAAHLIRITFPHDEPWLYQVFFNVSGGLAVKDAAHIARFLQPGNPAFIIFKNAFHGRVIPDLTFSNTTQRLNSPQGAVEVYEIPYPIDKHSHDLALEALSYIPNHVCALFVEGVQGEGGINVPHMGLLSDIIETIQDRFDNPLIISDEVQTGLGRTGKWFSYGHYKHMPDMVIVGKALGGSIPLSAVIAPACDVPAGMLGGTYAGGYPAAVAQAVVNLAIIEEEHLVENARDMGNYLYEAIERRLIDAELHSLMTTSKHEPEVIHKGLGLMQGVEFKAPTLKESEEWRNRAFAKMLDANLFTTAAGVRGIQHVIRIMPPLNVTRANIDLMVEKFMDAVITSAPK